MGVADRVRRKQAQMNSISGPPEGDSHQDSTAGSSLVLADPPYIRRLKGVVGAARLQLDQQGGGMARMAFILSTFADEIAEELKDVPEDMVRQYIFQVGELVSWVGHGYNERVPEGTIVREFVEIIQPSSADTEIVDAEIVDDDNNGPVTSSHRELGSATG